ncbi:MAG: sulfatase [Pirellulaceae bacterium]
MLNPRTLLRLLLVVVCGMTLAELASADEAAARPNILFFLSDDQRASFMGCAGHEILKTPTMDALAAGGVRFENTFVTTSICAASRATIFTGLYERTHRYTFGTPPIADELVAISYPVKLREAGYRTGFVGKFGVNVGKGLTQIMFDDFKPLNRSPYFKKQADGTIRYVEEIAGDHAIEFLKATKPGQPFCLQVSFNAPHAEDGDKENHFPWPPAVDGMYEDVQIPEPELSDPKIFESQPDFLKQSLNRERWFWRWDTPEKYQKNVRAYYRMISGIDNIMNRVLGELDRLGLADNTIVIFSGDNGYYKAARGFAGKWSHYEESLRVPLIIFDPRAPQQQRGKVVSAMTLNVDIPATILAYAGVQLPAAYQGESLRPWMQGQTPAEWRSDTFVEHLFNHPKIPKWEGVRDQRFVYARYFEQQPPYEFLHDLEADPQQLQNFVADERYVDVLAALRKRCDELRDHFAGQRTRLLKGSVEE